jgi:hypothetical protein
LAESEKSVFQDRADSDKIRYLREMRRFYDEVEQVGAEKGKVRNEAGDWKILNCTDASFVATQKETFLDLELGYPNFCSDFKPVLC